MRARGLTHAWVTSSRSGGGGCVEARARTGFVDVRDSKNRCLPGLRFRNRDWMRFVGELADPAGPEPAP